LNVTSQAVFISYASQDAEAAGRICQALQAAGIEVWFDQSELRGGDAWDQSIRQQIKTCALFVPIISKRTHERSEGYFRLEWKLAVDRSHLITSHKAFLLPVVIDETSEEEEHVPDKFREVQWTRLPGGVTPDAFAERVRRLLAGGLSQGPTETASAIARGPAAPSTRKPVRAFWRSKSVLLATIAVLVVAIGYLVANRLVLSKRGAEAAPATVFSPPPHSIAVLPFVNMSSDKEQEYFSEGLTEEVLNSLARLDELHVAARTSSFSFQGEHPDIATVAHKLNVGAVLEGSVRRSGHTVRITTQLVNGITGFHLWSQTYDRNLGDVLKLQAEIANAVASALKVTLLGDVTTKIEMGGTRNPAAFDAYLRAMKIYNGYQNDQDVQAAIADYTESIRLDPRYALAYAARSSTLASFARNWAQRSAVRDSREKAQADANQAIALAPDLAEGHMALAEVLADYLDFKRATLEFERARALAPGNARVLRSYSQFVGDMGRTDAGLSAARRSVELDPLNAAAHSALGRGLIEARRAGEAVVAMKAARALAPKDGFINARLGVAYYLSGDLQSARANCEASSDNLSKVFCLAVVYQKLGRHADAQSMLAKLRDHWGEDGAVWFAMIYAQWGDTARALDSLDTAMRRRSAYLSIVKVAPWFDSLRREPRFQAIERELKFPS
jgi:TolB-like protein